MTRDCDSAQPQDSLRSSTLLLPSAIEPVALGFIETFAYHYIMRECNKWQYNTNPYSHSTLLIKMSQLPYACMD